jgi:hypothetical protein
MKQIMMVRFCLNRKFINFQEVNGSCDPPLVFSLNARYLIQIDFLARIQLFTIFLFTVLFFSRISENKILNRWTLCKKLKTFLVSIY